ncbi:MAG: RNA polymerase sigma factor [Planctomycetaceae bacterium]
MNGEESQRLSPQQAGSLYLDCSEALLAFAWGLLRDWELAREVVQVTFGKALEYAGEVPPDARRKWLFKVARNEALALRRRNGVARKVQERLGAERRLSQFESRQSDIGASLLQREDVERVRKALESLPDAQREVVVQRIYEDKTFAEIAADSGLPLGTVLTRMRLALAKLEQALKST